MVDQPSWYQRFSYAVTRHAVAIACVLIAVILLLSVGNRMWLDDNLHLALGGLLQVGLGVSLILLVTKFAFPKLDVQERIKDEPLAVAVFFAGIAIAIALLF